MDHEWTRQEWIHKGSKAQRRTWAETSPLAWILEYQPKIRFPGKGLIPFDPFYAQQQLLLDRTQFRHLNKSRQLGYTTTFSIEALHDLIYTPQAEIIVLSKSEKEAVKFLDKFYTAYNSVIDVDPHVPSLTVENNKNAKASNGSTIDVLTSSRGAGRSFSATRLYMDEMAHIMYADDIYQAAMPTIAVTKGSVTLFSSPYGRAGKFAEIGKNADNYGFSGHQYEWWWSPMYNAYYPSFLKAILAGEEIEAKEIIEKARRHKMYKAFRSSFSGTDLAFQQEYECRYDASMQQVFSDRQIKRIFKPSTKIGLKHQEDYPFTEQMWTSKPKEGHYYITGIDLGRKVDATVIVTFDVTESPAVMVEYKRIPPGTADWHLIDLAIRDTYGKFKSECIHDATSMSGDAISEMLSDISEPFHIVSNVAKTGKKYLLIENLRRGADNEIYIMPKIEQLFNEFQQYQWDDKQIVQDSVIAVALAVNLFYSPENVATEVDPDFNYVGG